MKGTLKALFAAALAVLLLGCAAVSAEEAPVAPIHTPAVPVIGEDGAYSLDAADYADQWTLVTDEGTGIAYYMLDVVYCASPVDPAVQHLAIYAPEAYLRVENGRAVKNAEGSVTSGNGVVYTAETAPILYTNTSGAIPPAAWRT